MPLFVRLIVYALGAYLLLVAVLFVAQRRIIYAPDRSMPDRERAGVLDMATVSLATADGLDLNAWYRQAARDGAPTLVYLHGNAGHIGYRGGKVRPYLDAGYGVLLVSWRGYGGNPGRPNEQGLYEDARAALAFLDRMGVAAERIVLYGESLGSGPAVQVATEQPVGAVILEAPFTSIADAAQHLYWYLPARALIRDRYASVTKIERIGAPLLIVHGERDRTIPVDFGRQLLAAALQPKEGLFIAVANHNDLYEHGAPEAVIEFLDRIFP